MSNTILHFHTGRGGQFYNGGHRKFYGLKSIFETHIDDLFTGFEDGNEAYFKIKGRPNLEHLLDEARESGDGSEFTRRTGIELGEFGYVDLNGTFMISQAQMATGVGIIDRDGQYDTTECISIEDADANDMRVVEGSKHWAREQVLQEWVELQLEGQPVDWAKFDDDRYDDVIADLENNIDIDITEYYIQEEEEA